jgi:all-trans-8'-apo-beta-carotenal 15,15'-oxygenase
MVATAHPALHEVGAKSSVSVGDATDFAPGIDTVFDLELAERCYVIEEIEGRIPKFIAGTYYLNGPALFSRAGMRYRHWLDGDGMVCAMCFCGEGVRFANRFVRTTKFAREEEAGRLLFRTFGTAFEGDILKHGIALESPANVSVYSFHGKLLAFGEQALPWELHPETLETIGPFNFSGSLSEISPFSAHPKFDPATGEMFNFGVFFSGKVPKLYFYSFDKYGKLRGRASHPLDYPCSMHDFAISANYAVFYISPLFLDIEKIVRGGQSLMESLTWQPELGSRLLVLDRHTGSQITSVPAGGKYCLHLINCFEQDGKLVVDVIELDRPVYDQYQPLPDLFTNVSEGGPARFIVDLENSDIVERRELEYRLAPDFPALDPECSGRSYRDFWMLGLSNTGRRGRKFFDQLVHARWDESRPADFFQTAPGHYLGGEPIFIAGRRSGEGAVICQQFDAGRSQSSFLIFDAFNVVAGPVAELRLKDAIPLGFHASFVSRAE